MHFGIAVLFLFQSAFAFVAPGHHVVSQGGTTLEMSSSPPEEFLQRSQKVKSVLEDDETPPKLFEDDILDDIQQSLLKLETRVKGGPGSLTKQQVAEFEASTQRILQEMKEFNASGGASGPSSTASPATVAPVPSSSFPADSTSPPSLAQTPIKTTPMAASPTEPRATLHPGQTAMKSTDKKVTDTSNDEAPDYDGSGGMGLARGTANTYAIPGMDEMTPEEYRKALQKSVSDRQTRRHSSRGGVVGNRAAHEYLDNLGWGGASSNLGLGKGNEDEDEE